MARALPQALETRAQVDDRSAIPHERAVRRREDGAAARCHDQPLLCGEIGENGGLTPPKSILAFDLEDRRNRDSRALDEGAVGIGELALQPLGKRAAEGRLACPHHAHEEDVAFRHPRIDSRPSIAEKKAPETGASTGGKLSANR